MKEELEEELRHNLIQKVSTGLLLVIVFLASVQVMSYEVNKNSEVYAQNAERIADIRTAEAFISHYENQSMEQEALKVNNISRDILEQTAEEPEYGTSAYLATYMGRSLSVVNPFYPQPCSIDSSQGCRLYLNQDTVNSIEQTLKSVGTNESLRDFSQRYELNVSEEFYSDNSVGEIDAEGAVDSNVLNLRLGIVDYVVNSVYLFLFGFLLASVASIVYRKAEREIK